jgi:hypothetical protein
MFVYGVIAFLVFGVVTSAASTVMQIRVNDRVPKDERFSWWSRNYAEVGRKHRELFPDSPLPDIARYSGWVCLLLLAIGVLNSLLDR